MATITRTVIPGKPAVEPSKYDVLLKPSVVMPDDPSSIERQVSEGMKNSRERARKRKFLMTGQIVVAGVLLYYILKKLKKR
tara:strand:- start:863 stop:1105 length:243 start_codon:yes stop_codon:yes gene_type:complete